MLLLFSCDTETAEEKRSKELHISSAYFNTELVNGWRHHQGIDSAYFQNDYPDKEWDEVSIPHDASIHGSFSKNNPSFSRGAWLPGSKGTYRKRFRLNSNKETNSVFINFDGVYRNAKVYLNGKYIGGRKWGYVAFEFDITDFVNRVGENLLVVTYDNSVQPGSRWYSGSGIYRTVTLKERGPVYFKNWKTKVMTAVNEDLKTGVLKIDFSLNFSESFVNQMKNKAFTIKGELKSVEKEEMNVKPSYISKINLKYNIIKQYKDFHFSLDIKVDELKLWSVDHPNLYEFNVSVSDENMTFDEQKFMVGFSKRVFDADDGFILNNEPTKIKGVCIHHGAGPLGAAARKASYERQILKLKAMGVNAVRTAHNPFAKEFYAVCDSLGMLVMAEVFDEWKIPKAPATFRKSGEKIRIPIDYYAKIFEEESDKDLHDAVIRDRNHHSIFMWSIGNEIDDMHEPEGAEITMRLLKIVRALDDRPITNGVNGYGWGKFPNEEAVAQYDVAGYNYTIAENYKEEKAKHPNRKIIITEHTSAQPFRRRGEYILPQDIPHRHHLPYNHPDTKRFLDSRNEFERGISVWNEIKNLDYIMGLFIWTGFDYLGETIPYPWPARSSSFGVIDLAGFEKDGFYFYQSQWTKKPMVHGFPHWNWDGKTGEIIPVKCFSNAEEVSLYLNGRLIGTKKNNVKKAGYLEWKVPYESGELKFVAKNNGDEVASHTQYTAKDATYFKLVKSPTSWVPNHRNVHYIEVSVFDANHHFVPLFNKPISFKVSQGAKIIGTGNGDPMNHESFASTTRNAFNGRCLVIVETEKGVREFTITATSDGLKKTEQKLNYEQSASKSK